MTRRELVQRLGSTAELNLLLGLYSLEGKEQEARSRRKR
jgi:hypothetical protein